MRNLVSSNRTLSSNLTYSCHNLKFWEGEISELFGLKQIFSELIVFVGIVVIVVRVVMVITVKQSSENDNKDNYENDENTDTKKLTTP